MSLKITSYLVLPLNRAKFKTMTMLYKFTVKRLNNNNKQTVKNIVKLTIIATKIPYQCLCLFYNFCHLGFFLKAITVFCLFVLIPSEAAMVCFWGHFTIYIIWISTYKFVRFWGLNCIYIAIWYDGHGQSSWKNENMSRQ